MCFTEYLLVVYKKQVHQLFEESTDRNPELLRKLEEAVARYRRVVRRESFHHQNLKPRTDCVCLLVCAQFAEKKEREEKMAALQQRADGEHIAAFAGVCWVLCVSLLLTAFTQRAM